MKRINKQYQFWLNLNSEAECRIAEAVDWLKSQRLYSQTIRDGIRLIVSLRDGRTDVLFELFPWIQERLESASKSVEPPHEGNGHDDQIKALQAKIDTLTDLVTQQRTPNGIVISVRENQKALPPPKTDNIASDRLEIKQAAKSPENAGFNMLLNSAAMKVCRYQDLPPAVIAYGIERGKIPTDRLPQNVLNHSEDEYFENENPRKLAGADVMITAPVLDDLELTV